MQRKTRSNTEASGSPTAGALGRDLGAGRPLDPSVRRFMEPRFGQNFAQVRVHSDARAAASARAVNAMGYTIGNHVVFGSGQYEPTSAAGRSLLAHELAHVVQQQRRPATLDRKLRCNQHASLSEFLLGKGVMHFEETNRLYERRKGGEIDFEQDILIDMLASPRIFSVDGQSASSAGSNLDAHVQARIGIITFAAKKGYSFASLVGWKMNPQYYDWDISKGSWKMKSGVDRQQAWDDLNVNPQLYAIGCAAATDLTMKGGSKGAEIIDMPSSDTDDWVPGDAGYIENTKFRPGSDIGVLGENIIYTGNGMFWGHFSGNQTYRTLAEWIKQVESWNNGARVDEKRELPATGLLNA
jgi:hypothetical protein